MRTLFIVLSFHFFFSLTAQIPMSKYIHYDQFGYLPNAEKVAVLSDPQVGFNASDNYSPAGMIQLINEDTEVVVYEALPEHWNGGNTHGDSGDKGWWFDFSSVTTPGSYFILDPESMERSHAFSISPYIYSDVIKAAQKMFYYNRCNFPKSAPYAAENWTDGTNFLNPGQDATCSYLLDQSNPDFTRDLSGGWFDAGDFNKYVTFAEGPVHNLLASYEENPQAYNDDFNLPESGNDLPDILDEVKWELDWLLKMCNDDGSVHIKMGTIGFDDNTSTPPSANTDPRFYGPTCTSASIAIATMFSYASIIYKDFDGYEAFAETLKGQAEKCWNYVLPLADNNGLETDCDNQVIIAGDADRDVEAQKNNMITASIFLYEATGNENYHQYLLDHVEEAQPIVNNFWGVYFVPLIDALLRYSVSSNADENARNLIRESITADVVNNWNGYFGFNGNDLYRSFMPEWSYHWGSNNPKAHYAVMNAMLSKYKVNATDEDSYLRQLREHVHYFHGVNPLGLVMLSNMYTYGGDRCVNEIYHGWFLDGSEWDNALTSKGPAPGFVTGGPNKDFSLNTISPPANNPPMKSYLDFNDDWPNNSWEISEPAIYYQAAYIRMLAHLVAHDLTTATTKPVEAQVQAVPFSPNPVAANVAIPITFSSMTTGTIQLSDMQGKLLQKLEVQQAKTILLDGLPAGIYRIQLVGDGAERWAEQLVVQ